MPALLPDPAHFKVKVDIEVRWGDMDALGHVNNARYLTFFETARIAYLEMGDASVVLTRDGLTPILARTEIDYLRPVEYPATLTACVRCVRLGTTSMECEHLVLDKKSGEAVAVGKAVLVMFDMVKRTKTPVPESMRRKIREIDGVGTESVRAR